MTAPLPASLAVHFAPLLHARVEAAHLCPDSGLLVLSLYAGRKVFLGFGIGPRVIGLGFLPRLPRARASATHPLVSAMRAHLVDRRLLDLSLDEHALLLSVDPAPDAPPARIEILLGRRGKASLFTPSGALVAFPHDPPDSPPREGLDPSRFADSLLDHGAAMVEASDAHALDLLRTTLLRAVKAKLKSLDRRASAVAHDLERLDDAPRLQKIGRLLVAQAHSIPRGASRASLVDWEEGGSIDIDLAPDKPAKLQADAFFQKARRLQRGAAFMQKRLDDTLRERDALLPLQGAIADAPADPAALDALEARARALGVSAARIAAASPARSRDVPERKPFNTFRDALGRTILVGRGGKDNDTLITRFARPHDLWLHAKNIHGAHVVVPLDKGQVCPAELLVDAATLAAHFSDARGEEVCDVSYVERRYVRKPRKSAPGAVTFDHEKIIAVRLEPVRLQRLLASKQDS